MREGQAHRVIRNGHVLEESARGPCDILFCRVGVAGALEPHERRRDSRTQPTRVIHRHLAPPDGGHRAIDVGELHARRRRRQVGVFHHIQRS